tara:strand:- start:17647 stop:18204 length:558 start_codon:yes stop_codon:yes gene_type:complete
MTEPEIRSIQLMQSVIDETEGMTLMMLTNETVVVELKGSSGRWYRVKATLCESFPDSEQEMDWMTSIKGARRKADLSAQSSYNADLCLHSKNEGLPIGDRVASLILSLHNDLKTAMQIPLLAQFIICSREDLADILIIQSDIIVTFSMLDGEGETEPFEEFNAVEEAGLAYNPYEALNRAAEAED